MKKKVLFFGLLLGSISLVYPQTLTCSCGSQASGRTIEYQIADPGGDNIDCCRGTAIGVNNAYSFTWAPAGRGNYVLVSSNVYPTSSAAQNDCCEDNAA